jgi:hypothetical protein
MEKQREQAKLTKMDPDERLRNKMIKERDEKHKVDKIMYYTQIGMPFSNPTGPRTDKKEFVPVDEEPDIHQHSRLSVFSGDFSNLLRMSTRIRKNMSPRIS